MPTEDAADLERRLVRLLQGSRIVRRSPAGLMADVQNGRAIVLSVERVRQIVERLERTVAAERRIDELGL